ncbi:MAG: hypothetical protein GYA50_00405 [Eubacteriaceae bacterium]|nr:hypothetical protein [Eubacteriaceae bacterium]
MNYKDLENIEYVYLEKIYEIQDNYLRLTFDRCKIEKDIDQINNDDELCTYGSFEVDYTLPLIQIDFDWYIGYSVLNECFTVRDNYEKFIGKTFRIYTKSRYLDFIKAGTIASVDYPGPFKHYGIVCLNHIIDVVSANEPIIKEIQRQNNNI